MELVESLRTAQIQAWNLSCLPGRHHQTKHALLSRSQNTELWNCETPEALMATRIQTRTLGKNHTNLRHDMDRSLLPSSSFPSLFFTTRYLKMICSSTCSRPHSSEAWVKAEVWLIKKLPNPWPKEVKQKQTHGNKNLNSLGFFHKDLWNLGSSGDSTKFLIYDIPWPSNTQTNHNAWHTPSCTTMCPQLLPIGPNLDIIFGRGRCHGNQRREDGKVKRGPIAFHRWWAGYMRWTWQPFMIGYEEWIEIEGTQWYDYWLQLTDYLWYDEILWASQHVLLLWAGAPPRPRWAARSGASIKIPHEKGKGTLLTVTSYLILNCFRPIPSQCQSVVVWNWGGGFWGMNKWTVKTKATWWDDERAPRIPPLQEAWEKIFMKAPSREAWTTACNGLPSKVNKLISLWDTIGS